MDTVNYSQLDAIIVQKKSGRFAVRFSKSCHSKPWDLFAANLQQVRAESLDNPTATDRQPHCH